MNQLSDLGQAGAQVDLSRSQNFERAVRAYKQGAKDRQNFLRLEGLSLVKAYLEGNMRILLCMEYDTRTKVDQSIILEVRSHRAESRVEENLGAIGHGSDIILNGDFGHGWNEHRVLVAPVKEVQSLDVLAIPSGVRLYDIDDSAQHSLGRGDVFRYMALDGTFERIHVPPDWEMCEAPRSFPIRLNADNVCVIEGGPHVVNSIAEHCRCVAGKFPAERDGFVPIFIFGLTHEGLTVFCDVGVENRLKLIDVMFGPFGF